MHACSAFILYVFQEVSKLFGLFRDTLSEEDMTIPNLAQVSAV